MTVAVSVPRTRLALVLIAAAAVVLGAIATQNVRAQEEPTPGDLIAEEALKHEGTWGDQCWPFVRKVVHEATGNLMGFGYHDGFIEGGAVEVSLETARRGDIIQLADPSNNGPGVYYSGLHTTIVLERYDDGTFKVVDSNYGWDEMVSVHDYDPAWAAGRYSHIQPRVYRFTSMEGEAPPASEPASTQEPDDLDFGAGDRVSVSAGGDCLNMRDGAGLAYDPPRYCIPHGSELTVIDGPVAAGSYTWVQVRMDDGTEGWVAATFLEVVDQPAPGASAGEDQGPTATPTPEPTSTPEPTPEPADDGSAGEYRQVVPGLFRTP